MVSKSLSGDDPVVKTPGKGPNGLVRLWRGIYRPMGFSKGYNFNLFVIFAGAMLGFSLARISYLNIAGTEKSSFATGASPGEWYWYKSGYRRVGITIHLGAILPAGLLMVWQFVLVIRHKVLLFHRINGYIIILLVLISNVGALMIARRSFGGSAATQAGVGSLVILTTISLGMAYYNIKRLQIEQHRAWMLRAMFYLGTIITLRLILIISALVISSINDFYTVMPCDEITFISGSEASVSASYPQCSNLDTTTDGYVAVKADFYKGGASGVGASLDMSFGMAMWLAILMHLVGVEIYLNLTTAETERLRNVSYEKQLEAGMKNPGSAGLTADRWGDAPAWRPASE